MTIESFPREDFLEIKPLLDKLYGLDDIMLNNAIHFAKDELFYDPEEESKVDSERYIYLPLSPKYSVDWFYGFCQKYKIENNSTTAKILHFLYMFLPIEDPFMTDSDYWEYVTLVRPEMLRLYRILRGGKTKYRKNISITYGHKSITVDTEIPWLQMELERYLDKYLGVKNVVEAEEELETIYKGKAGPKQNIEMARVIWGTFHLLNMTNGNEIPKIKSVSNAHSKLIAGFLILLGWLPKYESDGEHVRALMNYYRKKYKSISDLIKTTQYKLSPNSSMTYY
jgi:hypothetical protein